MDIHIILAPYCKRKIEIYECKNKISRQENNIQTVLDELKKLKTIDTDNLTLNELHELKHDIISIITKYTRIINFFNGDQSTSESTSIKETLEELKKEPSESQYRQYTYKKS